MKKRTWSGAIPWFLAVAKQGDLVFAGGRGGAIRVPATGKAVRPVQINFGLGDYPITGLGVKGARIFEGHATRSMLGTERRAYWKIFGSAGDPGRPIRVSPERASMALRAAGISCSRPPPRWGSVIHSVAGSRSAKLMDAISLPLPDEMFTLPVSFPVPPENATASLRKKNDKVCACDASIRIATGKTNSNFPSAPVTAETFFEIDAYLKFTHVKRSRMGYVTPFPFG